MHPRTRAWIGLVAAVTLLALAACATKATPRSALGGLGPSAAPRVSGAPTTAPSPTTSARPGATATATARGGGNHGAPTHGTSSQPSTSTSPLTGVSVDMITPDAVYTVNCPYVYTMRAIVTATQPVDLTYTFAQAGFKLQAPVPLHFSAAGQQTLTYPDYSVSPPQQALFTDSIVVTGPGGSQLVSEASFTVECLPRAGRPVATPAKAICPYVTTLSVSVSVTTRPNTWNYRWVFANGSQSTGTLTFPVDGPFSQVVSIKRVVQQGNTVSVVFYSNEHSGGTDPVTATCLP